MSNRQEERPPEQVEGKNPVIEALRGPRRVHAVYLAPGRSDRGATSLILSLAGERGVPVKTLPHDEFERLSHTASPQGVIARVSKYPYLSVEELHGNPGRAPLFLALDGVQDPQNFGSLLRVAEGCGVDGVLVPARRSCPVTPAVCKASAGAAEHVKIARVPNLCRALENLKRRMGLWVAGACADGDTLYSELDLTVPLVLVLGGENKGIRRLVREHCDMLARVPMTGRVNSLNVAACGAIILYEALRQRAAAGPGTDTGA